MPRLGPASDGCRTITVSEALAELVPGAAGPVIERDICLYTNTLPADRRPDKGEEFIIDRWPNSRLIVASPCSGHGSKFAPAIGEKLARPSPSILPTRSNPSSVCPDALLSPDRIAYGSTPHLISEYTRHVIGLADHALCLSNMHMASVQTSQSSRLAVMSKTKSHGLLSL